MHTLPRFASTLGGLAMIACGPPPVGAAATTAATETSGGPQGTESEDSGSIPETTYIPDPDPDHSPEPVSCDPFVQDCPEGEKCVIFASDGRYYDGNKCVPVLGEQAPGEPCNYDGALAATDDCDESSACWNIVEIDGELVGICSVHCSGTPDNPECPEGSSCQVSGDGTVPVCIDHCDPIAQDCPSGFGCFWSLHFQCISSTQNIPAGEPCGFINDCAPGHLCATAEVMPDCVGSACCSPYCDLQLGAEQCASVPGTICSGFFEQGWAPPGYEHVGVCILP